MEINTIAKIVHGSDYMPDDINPIYYGQPSEDSCYYPVGGNPFIIFVSRQHDLFHDIVLGSDKHEKFSALTSPGFEQPLTGISKTEYLLRNAIPNPKPVGSDPGASAAAENSKDANEEDVEGIHKKNAAEALDQRKLKDAEPHGPTIMQIQMNDA